MPISPFVLYPILFCHPLHSLYGLYRQITIPSAVEEIRETNRTDLGQPGRPSAAQTLRQEIEPLLDQNRITKNIEFYEIDKKDFSPTIGAGAAGSDLIKGALVFITKGFYEIDKEASGFLVKHEIGHIKHNDGITIPSLLAICHIASICLGLAVPSFALVHAIILVELVNIIAHPLITNWREAKADDFAIKHSSPQELVGGIRFFRALQEKYIEKRNTHLWNRLFFSSSGESRLDTSHPSLASRIQKIQKALRTREVPIDLINQPNLQDLKAVLFA